MRRIRSLNCPRPLLALVWVSVPSPAAATPRGPTIADHGARRATAR